MNKAEAALEGLRPLEQQNREIKMDHQLPVTGRGDPSAC